MQNLKHQVTHMCYSHIKWGGKVVIATNVLILVQIVLFIYLVK
jgi:hypothetical protein